MEEFDDGFGDLYADVEVQASSAINTFHGFSQFPLKKVEIFYNGIGNCCYNEFSKVPKSVDSLRNNGNGELPEAEELVVEEEEVEEEGEEKSSDSEDELNIVLNDDGDGEIEKNGVTNGNLDGNEFVINNHGSNRGWFDYKGNDEIESCKNAMEQSSGGAKFGSGYNLQYKNMRFQTPALPCDLRANGSPSVASYSSKYVQDESKDDGYSHHLNPSSLASQSGFNFSLPRSRTILDVNIDSFKCKPWRHPGADITDYFNFGFNENSWKQYFNSLDTYRHQISGGRYSCKSSRHNTELEVGIEHEEISHKVETERNDHPVKLQSGMIRSGRAIQVKECVIERQPSKNTWGPLDRDSSVVIQIAVQDDMNEDCLNSAKEGEGQAEVDNQDILLDEARELLCFSSASEDELSSLAGDDEKSCKSVSESGKSCRQSPISGSVSKNPEIDHKSSQILDADVVYRGKCTGAVPIDEGIDTSIESGASAERRLSDAGPSEPKSHLNHGDQSPHSVTRPTSQSHHGYGCGTLADLRKSSNKLKFDSPNFLPEARDSRTYDCYLSEESKKYGVKSKHRDHAFCSSSGRALQPDLSCNANKPVHMDGEASNLSANEWFSDSRHSTIYHEHNGLDSYYGKRNSYCKTTNSFPNSGDHKLSNYDVRDRYMKRPNWKGSSSEYDLGQNGRNNINGKKRHFEQNFRVDQKERRQGLFFDERRYDLQYMESQLHGGSRHWQSKSDRFLEKEGGKKWKTEKYDWQLSREVEDLLVQSSFELNLTRDHRKSVSSVVGIRDCVQHEGDKHLSYSRREVESSGWSQKRCDQTFNGHDDEQYAEYDDDREGCSRFSSQDTRNRPISNCRERLQGGSFPRDGMDENHSRNSRSYAERSFNIDRLGVDRLGHYSSFDTDVRMRNVDNQDSFIRRDHEQCGVSSRNGEHHQFEQTDNEVLPGGSCGFYKRDPNRKNIDPQHGANLSGNHINHLQAGRGRFRMTRGHKHGRFLKNSNVIRNDNCGNKLPQFRSSIDSHLVGVDRKYSGRRLGGRNMCNSRYEYIDDDTCMKLKTFADSEVDYPAKANFSETSKFVAKQTVGKQRGKFSRVEHNESEDIEEGQVVTEELKERAKEEKIGKNENAKDVKVALKGHDNPKIREILAKMERRRERFNRPIPLKKDSEIANPTPVDTDTETCNSNPQRPARKRRWDGTLHML